MPLVSVQLFAILHLKIVASFWHVACRATALSVALLGVLLGIWGRGIVDVMAAKLSIQEARSLKLRSASPRVRILVVEDHERFRRYVSSTLKQQANVEIVGEFEDGLQAVEQAKTLRPDLIILDIGLPRLNGIEAARQIRKVASTTAIIFLTQESSLDVVEAAFGLGAWGYVVKAHAGSELVAAVNAVSRGKRFVSRGLDHLFDLDGAKQYSE